MKCPVCKNYTLAINELEQNLSARQMPSVQGPVGRLVSVLEMA
jgi:hypothetical protein